MTGLLHKWRVKILQGTGVLLLFAVCYVLIDQTKNEVVVINPTSVPVTIVELFCGNKIRNDNEPFGQEYVRTKDSVILKNHVLGPNQQLRRTFGTREGRLFRVAYISSKGENHWYDTGAVWSWGSRETFRFGDRDKNELKSVRTTLRSWVDGNRSWLPLKSSWLD